MLIQIELRQLIQWLEEGDPYRRQCHLQSLLSGGLASRYLRDTPEKVVISHDLLLLLSLALKHKLLGYELVCSHPWA